jgi:putative spermidine/putrescine transport system permease protein
MRNKTVSFLLLLPILLLYGGLVGGGLIETLIESLGFLPSIGLRDIGFDAYQRMVEKTFHTSLLFSISIAFVSSSLSTVFGVLIAYALTTTSQHRIRGLVQTLMQVGLILPYLYAVFMVTTFFGQSGMVSRVFHGLGITSAPQDFPRLVFDPAGIGMVLAFVFKGTPFVALFSFNVMSHVSSRYGSVARTLGAGNLTILRRIYLPLCSPVLVWSASVLFAYNLGSFEVPYLLGSLRPATLSATLYSLFISPDILDIPTARASSLLLLGIGLASLALYAGFIRFLTVGRRRT